MPLGRKLAMVAGFSALTAATPLEAQSTTAGALAGVVLGADGSALGGAAITVTPAGGGGIKNLESLGDGSFSIRMVAPGTYSILFEVIGYQPLRLRSVVVVAGGTTTMSVRLQQRPPPITSVTESDDPGVITGGMGRVIADPGLLALESRRDATDLTRGMSEVIQPIGGAHGFALGAGGLPAGRSRMFVDGIPELMLSHPGNPRSVAVTPVFALDGIEQARLLGTAADAEWRGVAGSVLHLNTRRGQNHVRFAPFATWSGSSIGGNALDNPADSSATSFQVGATLSGALKPDTAHFFLRGDYQSLETPSAFPWEQDTTRYKGQLVSLRNILPSIGTDSFGTQLGSTIAPALRTWKGGSAAGRVDWQLSRSSQFMLRGGFASWKETNPPFGWDAGNDAGGSLKARDLSIGVSILTTSRAYANEVRVGLSASKREWAQGGAAATLLVGEGVRIGGNAGLPGLFDIRTLGLSESLQYFGGRHTVKAGVSLDHTTYRQNYQFGSAGVYQFGDLDQFGSAQGTFYRTVSDAPEARFSYTVPGLFLEDSYEVSTGLKLLLGLRWETQILPKKGITPNTAWAGHTGVLSDSAFRDRKGFQPRVGFVLNPGNRSTWVLQGEIGLYADGLDPSVFAEALGNDGSVTVTRGAGTFAGWPAPNGASGGLTSATRLTLLTNRTGFRAPRTFKGDVGLIGNLSAGLTLRMQGAYHHTDYLLRRTDLNRAEASGETQEGRPVYGTLVKQGGLIFSATNSSRRFADFDMVSSLAPTGFSDHYEVTASLERRVTSSLSLFAAYTYSKTRDNLVGLLASDPADQFSPLPDGTDGVNWDQGRSDLDIPHRIAVTAEFRTAGRMPLTLAARGRWRSGLSFTPGFRAGVDVNGDLGGNNDPAGAASVPTPSGVGAMATCDALTGATYAARNSCRENGVGALDLRLTIGVPFGRSNRLSVVVDGFSLLATTSGVVDHAALLIDPAAAITTSGTVHTLPLVPNARFGTLLSRRTEPRLVRLGLRVEY